MQADTLRLILLGLGVVLILGIYLWERRRSSKSGARSRPRAQETPPEPSLEPGAAGQDARTAAQLTAEEEFADLPPLHVEHPDLKPTEKKDKPRKGPFGWGKRSEEPPAPRAAPEAPQTTEEHYRQVGSGVPHLILMINVAAKQGRFPGVAIAAAAARVSLEQGAMNIYHRYEQPGVPRRVLFSMANMLEPGTFPFDDLRDFSTPGLSLFAQLPGPRDGQHIYDTMLSVARSLADALGGELRDETHSVLSRQTIEHVRTQIAEHHRQVALATKQG